MIGWDDIYKVVEAMVPLYVALILGYGSVKLWQMFTPEHSDIINRMNCYFILPFFTFEFTTHINPFNMNHLYIAADILQKIIIGAILGIWACFGKSKKNNLEWSITGFSLSTLNNTLVVGVPLMSAMYGALGEELVIQSSVLQSIIWFMILLFLLELRYARIEFDSTNDIGEAKPSFWVMMKIVLLKLSKNPNSYACVLGVVWSLLSSRWNLEMPSIIEGSILIMSKAGSGVSMFCMGLFMASTDKIIACGINLAVLGMALRFIGAPLAMAIASLTVGLHGDAFKIAVIQSATPQAITTFIYAKEYKLHADVLSTAVIFGTLASLPILSAYYAIVEAIH